MSDRVGVTFRQVTDGDTLTLAAGELLAVVLTPWSARYRRTRFNHAGFIAEVTLGGVRFTGAEGGPEAEMINRGMGLCCEYKCPELDRDVQPGEQWLKPGVGVLTRGEAPWTFKDETECEGLPTEVSASADTARFTCESPVVSGYGYREERTLKVTEHTVLETVRLTNTGSREMDLLDYSHNFLSMNGKAVDEHTHLLLPCVPGTAEIAPDGAARGDWNGVAWNGVPQRYFLYKFFETKEAAFCWHLYRDDGTWCAAERLSEKASQFVLFGDSHTIAPEAYVRVYVKPGETKEWAREWFFRA